jgi:hypothetical protein
LYGLVLAADYTEVVDGARDRLVRTVANWSGTAMGAEVVTPSSVMTASCVVCSEGFACGHDVTDRLSEPARVGA